MLRGTPTANILASLAPILTIKSDQIVRQPENYIVKEVQIFRNRTIFLIIKDGQEKRIEEKQVISDPEILKVRQRQLSFNVHANKNENESFRLEIEGKLFGGGGCFSTVKVAPEEKQQLSSEQESESDVSRRVSYAKNSKPKSVVKASSQKQVAKVSDAKDSEVETREAKDTIDQVIQAIDAGNKDQLTKLLPGLTPSIRQIMLPYIFLGDCPINKKREMLEILWVERVTNVNYQDENGDTLLMHAVSLLNEESGTNSKEILPIIKFLMERNANPNKENKEKETPLGILQQIHFPDFQEEILKIKKLLQPEEAKDHESLKEGTGLQITVPGASPRPGEIVYVQPQAKRKIPHSHSCPATKLDAGTRVDPAPRLTLCG